MARLSLHAAVKDARLIQRLKGRLRSLIQACLPSVELCRLTRSAKLKTYSTKTVQGVTKSHSTFGRCLAKIANHLPTGGRTVKSTISQRSGPQVASVLEDLEQYAEYGCFSLGTIAAHGRLFSQHELHLFGIVKSIDELENLLHFTSALLCRLQDRSGSLAVQENGGLGEDSLSGELNCDKYVASLQHVLWSLQHSVVDAIIRHYLNLIEADVLHWNRYWQRSKRIGDDGWFAEWPNSHRPLSTTWPWNIKPSLLVLWGVCWMFYGPSGNNNKRRPTRNPRGAAHLSEDLRTGPLGSQSQPSQQPGISSRQQRYDLFNDKDWKDPSEVWAGPASDTYPNYSWLHPTQAGVSRRANNDQIVTIDTLPTTSVSSYPYISAPSSNLYPTSTVTWPYCQGINPASSPAYAPSYSPWQTQSPFNPTGGLTTTPQRTDRSNTVQPYAQRIQTANTGNPPVATGTPGGLGFGLGLHMTDMQDYPSPGSSTSGQTASSYIPVPLPSVLSPGLPLMPSPSVAESTVSRQSSRRSQEPPRNAAGLLYCNHAEHAQQQPPVFSRKCEWRKHMDKHERPYVCEEPECEHRGFTYSGGLTRHQREVHRQHGGPKATCMCPYPDCKRHVGVGFSRKENLAEHLRRVHRVVDADQMQKEASQGAQNTTSSGALGTGTKKRRRAVPEDDGGDDDDEEDLEQEVKKLKRELHEKDERLEKLEKQVQVLMRGHK